jgi:hypothetical protein
MVERSSSRKAALVELIRLVPYLFERTLTSTAYTLNVKVAGSSPAFIPKGWSSSVG